MTLRNERHLCMLTEFLVIVLACLDEDVLHGHTDEAERLATSRRVALTVEPKHSFSLRREEEVLGRDPRRELLLDRQVALVVLGNFAVEAVARILQVALSDLHALRQHHLLRGHHLEHVCIGWNRPVRLESPEPLVRAATMVLHEFLHKFSSRFRKQ